MEAEKVLFPFKNKNTQRVLSIILIIIGLLIMIVKPLSNRIDSVGLDSYLIGLIISFVGFFILLMSDK